MNAGAATGEGLRRIAGLLRGHPAVAECRVLERGPGRAVVAYVVPRHGASLSEAMLADAVRPQAPDDTPVEYILLANLPLTDDGRIDDDRLRSFGPIDADLVDRCGDALRRLGIDDAVVRILDRPRERLLHVSDLAPGAEADRVPEETTEGIEAPRREGEPAAVPAEAAGESLRLPADAPLTLTEALIRTAQRHGDQLIVLPQADDGAAATLTYASLLTDARRLLAGLRAAGLGPGDAAILQIDDLAEFFPVFWACVIGGIRPMTVAVPASYDGQNAVVQKLRHAWTLVGEPPVIADRTAAAALSASRDALGMRRLRILTAQALAGTAIAEPHASRPDEVAFYQLSSGSTGVPKCIQITHRGVVAHVQGRQQRTGYSAADVTLNWLPMDHVAPLLMCHVADTCVGCRQVHVAGASVIGAPLRWLDLLARYRVTHTWSPNFGYKLVADALAASGDRHWDLSCVKAFINGGEQVTAPVVRAFLERVAPFGVQASAMQPVFGMAETCTAVAYESPFDLERSVQTLAKSSLAGTVRTAVPGEPAVSLVRCGRPAPGVAIRIASRAGGVLSERAIGRVQVKGPVTTPGYLGNDEADRETLLGDGWLNTGDLGFLHDGGLTITGREKELITINGANYYCYDIEDIVRDVPGVDAASVGSAGVPDAATGSEALAIFFALDPAASADAADVAAAIRRELAARIGLAPAVTVPIERAAFPKTTSGKIQRGRLKAALVAGEFAPALRQLDLRLRNGNTQPDWFHRRVWVRKRPEMSKAPGVALVFDDGSGVGRALQAAWAAHGSRCVLVRGGSRFMRAAADEYALDDADRGQVERLLESLAREAIAPAVVVQVHGRADRGALTAPPAAEEVQRDAGRVAQRTLALVQALAARRAGDDPLRLVAVTRGAYGVLPGDEVVPASSMASPLLKTAAAELSWLRCRHVDADGTTASMALLPHACACPTDEREVAIRDGEQRVARIDRVDLQDRRPDPAIRPGGTYLVSGGTGGIGTEISTHLLSRFHGRVILTGRRPCDDAALNDLLAKLGRLPGRVQYLQADWGDAASRSAAIDRLQAAGPLDGVFHLAGGYRERPLVDETPRSLEEAWRPKAIGAWALHRLIEPVPGSLFVSLSSVNGLAGSYGAGAYAAANAFLEALSCHQRQRGLRSYCFAFSRWDRVGMSGDRQPPEAIRVRGYYSIERTQALRSLLAGLTLDEAMLLVGLDDTNRHIRRHLLTPDVAVRRLAAFVPGSRLPALAAAAPTVVDRFGMPVPVDIRDRRELPEEPHGERAADGATTAVTDAERAVAEIWSRVLSLASVGAHENVFDLGGTSLDVARIASALADALGRPVTTTDIYHHPTVAALAAHFLAPESANEAVAASSRRGDARRDAVRARAALPRGGRR
ncbi:MAG: SDR family NAD(P)-dependent oxidoreductase [Acidobacteria bacterium]|nr:SDR family NAD(P)-dependent oxidoreductase [Acidobacteriota bacterium]